MPLTFSSARSFGFYIAFFLAEKYEKCLHLNAEIKVPLFIRELNLKTGVFGGN